MSLSTLLFIVGILVLHEVVGSKAECPALFLRYTKSHSYCKPANPTCNMLQTFVDQKGIEIILKEHNTLRSKIAQGGVQGLPPAADMLQMVWDDELAAVAQKHAEQCLFQHDCNNCRRVQNFGVGQNLASETVSNSPNIPEPNWPSAIKSWYDEVAYFPKNAAVIDSFIAPPSEPTYGHFSQLVWATSWRIGCGYVLYKEGNMYQKLYVCNYGPAGNTVSQSMYKRGQPSSGCPQNSCSLNSCGESTSYPGLCKITDDKGPTYPQKENFFFYCDFNSQDDCNSYVTGKNNWLIYNTLSGNYLGILLKGGEESTMVFNKKITPPASNFCFGIKYRKGPNVDGEEEAHTATEIFTITQSNYEVKQNLPSYSGDLKQQFSEFSMSLSWNMDTKFSITFSVPAGKPEQFLEIQSLYAKDGQCKP